MRGCNDNHLENGSWRLTTPSIALNDDGGFHTAISKRYGQTELPTRLANYRAAKYFREAKESAHAFQFGHHNFHALPITSTLSSMWRLRNSFWSGKSDGSFVVGSRESTDIDSFIQSRSELFERRRQSSVLIPPCLNLSTTSSLMGISDTGRSRQLMTTWLKAPNTSSLLFDDSLLSRRQGDSVLSDRRRRTNDDVVMSTRLNMFEQETGWSQGPHMEHYPRRDRGSSSYRAVAVSRGSFETQDYSAANQSDTMSSTVPNGAIEQHCNSRPRLPSASLSKALDKSFLCFPCDDAGAARTLDRSLRSIKNTTGTKGPPVMSPAPLRTSAFAVRPRVLDSSRSTSSARGYLAGMYSMMERADIQEKSRRHEPPRDAAPHHNSTSELLTLLPIPMGAGDTRNFSERVCVPLAIDEDQNWLSEFLCFVRAELVEIFRASEVDVQFRNRSKKVIHGQVGIRCRYCAHLPPSARASRSSSYPFTLSRIYQSLTMMLRDHFGTCESIPVSIKEQFLKLKGRTPQGATGSNNFWEYSARKRGLIDSEWGIWIDENADHESVSKAAKDARKTKAILASSDGEVSLVIPDDRMLVSDFLYNLMTHVQLIHMEESEKIGNRKNLQIGLAGIGCRHCCQLNRKGLCRIFPARRRTLPSKVYDLYNHIGRCTLCPKHIQDKLLLLKHLDDGEKKGSSRTMMGEKEFFDRVWARMGYDSDTESQLT